MWLLRGARQYLVNFSNHFYKMWLFWTDRGCMEKKGVLSHSRLADNVVQLEAWKWEKWSVEGWKITKIWTEVRKHLFTHRHLWLMRPSLQREATLIKETLWPLEVSQTFQPQRWKWKDTTPSRPVEQKSDLQSCCWIKQATSKIHFHTWSHFPAWFSKSFEAYMG